jgi:hypothetical protein
MKSLILAMMTLSLGWEPIAQAFDCSDQKKITLEIIEAELSGIRSQASDDLPTCFSKKEFKSIRPVHQISGESHYLKPEFLIPKSAAITVLKETDPLEKRRVIEVRFSYPTVEGKVIEDELLYRRISPSRAQRRGCAEILSLPAHFSLRTDCVATPTAVK